MNSIYEIRILVVDDNTDLLRLLQEQLTDAGYRHIQTVRSCGAKQISPHCFCQPGMQTPTACLGWVSARMIT